MLVGRGKWALVGLVAAAACGKSHPPQGGPAGGAHAGKSGSGSGGSKAGSGGFGGVVPGTGGVGGGAPTGEGGGDADGGTTSGGTMSGAGGRGGRGGKAGAGAGGTGAVGESGSGGDGESGDGGNHQSGAGDSNAGSGGATGGGAGGTNQCNGGKGGKGGTATAERRLPLPCDAPLPTGYCISSESYDSITQGQSSHAGGVGTVGPSYDYFGGAIGFDLDNLGNGDYWSIYVAALEGDPVAPGLYDPVTRFLGQQGPAATFDFFGNGRGCPFDDARVSVEELEHDTKTITRFSATFELHCIGDPGVLRGVVNFNATGVPDPTRTPDWTIPLAGDVFRTAYDSVSNVAYGLDATNHRLSKIDLACGRVTYADVIQTPTAACVDSQRRRLFVVNKGSNLITEHDTADLSLVRTFTWAPKDSSPNNTRFWIHCGPEALYVVDGASAPGLFTVTELDSDAPVVTDHSSTINGVGALAMTADGSSLYYAFDSQGWAISHLHRLRTSDLSEMDATGTVESFMRYPLDAPLLLDEGRGLIFSKNKVFDASDLPTLVNTIPGWAVSLDQAIDNAYALDPVRGRLATQRFIHDLDRLDIVEEVVAYYPEELFFDGDGALWSLSRNKDTLTQQIIGN
jgi:hypothetical protein